MISDDAQVRGFLNSEETISRMASWLVPLGSSSRGISNDIRLELFGLLVDEKSLSIRL